MCCYAAVIFLKVAASKPDWTRKLGIRFVRICAPTEAAVSV